MLQLVGVDVCYGQAQALFGLTMAVRTGEAVALIGRNGAGKSTVLRTIIGLQRPSAGRLLLDGTDITALPTHEIARLGVGYVPEDRRVFSDLTVAENLEVGRLAPRPGIAPWTDERVLTLFPALSRLLARRAGALSGGEQQMLVVARTLLGNPKLLLLDEPSEGLAPIVTQQLTAALTEVKRQGVAILLSEQNLSLARHLADRAYGLDNGHIRHEAPLAELIADDSLRHLWLGL